jgi:SNF2 family DNA or RNA helicase
VGLLELVAPRNNPKLQEALNIIEECGNQKVIIWTRFKAELAGMANVLDQAHIPFVEFHGGVDEQERIQARTEFQNNPDCKVFLGNPAAGGIGLNLFAATVVLYLSNSFSTETRLQSEDRAHRIGTTQPVTYYDIVCPNTVDVKVLKALRENRKIADEVMKDGVVQWL